MNDYLLVLSLQRRDIPNYNDWLTEGRKRVKKKLDERDEEYREYLKEEYPRMYWGFEFTPDPPEKTARRLGLTEYYQSSTNGTDNTDTTSTLSDKMESRVSDIVRLSPTSNSELAEAWDYETGKEAYAYISKYLDDYYYRDEDSRIRATPQAEQLDR